MDAELLNEGSLLPFTAADHAKSINSLPSVFGQLNGEGMFPPQGLNTRFVRIDIDGGVIRALPTTPNGRPSTIARHEKGNGIIFEIPNISHEDSVLAHDVRDWLAQARRSRDSDDTLALYIERRHKRNRLKFDVTWEVMKMSALKGKIIDGAGVELYDLYDVFDIEPRTVYLDLDNEDSDVPALIEEIIGSTEDALTDETMDGVEARVSREIYNKIIRHKMVERYFQNTPAMYERLLNQQRVRNDRGAYRQIDIGGLLIKEYRAQVTLWGADAPTRLLAPDEGVAYAEGTADTHHTYAAPPLDIRELDGSDVGVDDLIHFSEETMKHGAGLEWKYQANAIPIWARPNLLTKISASADPG